MFTWERFRWMFPPYTYTFQLVVLGPELIRWKHTPDYMSILNHYTHFVQYNTCSKVCCTPEHHTSVLLSPTCCYNVGHAQSSILSFCAVALQFHLYEDMGCHGWSGRSQVSCRQLLMPLNTLTSPLLNEH